jgi:hypothetical protein
VFRGITLHGKRGEIVYGRYLAAALSSWVVTRNGETRRWALSAAVERADSFQLTRRPLQFTAVRTAKPAGFWCFDVETVAVKNGRLTATLSPPLQETHAPLRYV